MRGYAAIGLDRCKDTANLGDVRWLATEDGSQGKGTGRHIACFVLEPKEATSKTYAPPTQQALQAGIEKMSEEVAALVEQIPSRYQPSATPRDRKLPWPMPVAAEPKRTVLDSLRDFGRRVKETVLGGEAV